MPRVHAFGDDALGDLDAVALADAIRSGRLSRADVVEAAIARTEAVNPALNGLAHAAFDRARAAAGRFDSGFFDGVPTFIKDNVDVAGQPSMRGTDAWQPRPARADSEVTQVLLGTGLIALGKTQMSEFGFSAAAEHPRLGPVRNPWNTDYTAGASSSGSGAFVAAGVVPIAHANDGGGSIRIPAACNGLVGLKPSRGRFPLDPEHRRLPVGIVANGVLTRSVRDTAAVYREAERIWRNHRLPPVGDVTRPGQQRLTIAVVTGSVHRDASPDVRRLTLRTAALLQDLGHRVEHVDQTWVPASFLDDFVLYWGFLAWMQVNTGRRAFGRSFDRTRLDNLTLGLARHAARNLHRLPLAITRLRRLRRRSAEFFGIYDALLTPTLAEVTPRVGYLAPTDYQQVMDRLTNWVAFTPLQNVTGEPAISLPLAHSADGMPVGMMLSADIGREARLLELAYELEEAQPFARIQANRPSATEEAR
ncbi:amidase [Mycobacterium shinjukuense]|uniref:amidase n=1 Tax=Mycobacterium shinjukuense TaxID=398694 RepID=A0A7I7MPY2_9MYCO|nr:amidase [Mycobacterium shinjukuense]MCV6985682.1 amidase [Mycobacterium shinjukuense]ORB71571.1 amidase [Mycobacterium shinjukuense]BBX74331.1 putative amidase AmiC [Mycobacterium shinjukuense]